jgi:hypothetical protein
MEVQAGSPVDRPAPAIAQLGRCAAMVLAVGKGPRRPPDRVAGLQAQLADRTNE